MVPFLFRRAAKFRGRPGGDNVGPAGLIFFGQAGRSLGQAGRQVVGAGRQAGRWGRQAGLLWLGWGGGVVG